jgi:hypothetical protein
MVWAMRYRVQGMGIEKLIDYRREGGRDKPEKSC